jgi:energy-converting hydrogenase Eha subunit B
MRFVGPFTRDVLVHSVSACGVGALVGAAVVALLVWRSNRAWPDPAETAASVED